MKRVVLVPGVLALKPEFASLDDPVADVRRTVLDALAWAGPSAEVIGDSRGVIRDLLAGPPLTREIPHSSPGKRPFETENMPFRGRESALSGPPTGPFGEPVVDGLVVVGNGSAKRTEKAPGHFDGRAAMFDDGLREALTVNVDELARIDLELAAELWAEVEALPALADVLRHARLVSVDYDDDPYGVKYWVIRWEVSDGA